MTRRPGFTLIEILVVISVIAILSSLSLGAMGSVKRNAKRNGSLAVMHKVDTALRLFKEEIGSFPYQLTYPDPLVVPINRLYYHLGKTIQDADLALVKQDADTAMAQYAYNCRPLNNPNDPPSVSNQPVEPAAAPASGSYNPIHQFRIADVRANAAFSIGWSKFDNCRLGTAAMLNRMAQERARLAIFSGNVDVTGCHLLDGYDKNNAAFTARSPNPASAKLVASPASATKPGWAGNYLLGELEPRFIAADGVTILDAWKRPLLYICQVVEGTRSAGGWMFDQPILWIDTRQYGLHRQGRMSLLANDPESGLALTANPPFLPDPVKPMHSDMRYYAGPGFAHEFELWSVGPDAACDWMRDAHVNADNIPLAPYHKGIP